MLGEFSKRHFGFAQWRPSGSISSPSALIDGRSWPSCRPAAHFADRLRSQSLTAANVPQSSPVSRRAARAVLQSPSPRLRRERLGNGGAANSPEYGPVLPRDAASHAVNTSCVSQVRAERGRTTLMQGEVGVRRGGAKSQFLRPVAQGLICLEKPGQRRPAVQAVVDGFRRCSSIRHLQPLR